MPQISGIVSAASGRWMDAPFDLRGLPGAVCQVSLKLFGLGAREAETRAARKPWDVEDGLRERIEPLLPVVDRRFRHPGRKCLDDRKFLCGILFVLYAGIPWRILPRSWASTRG